MTTPSGRILTVGAGQQYGSLNAALAASQDGDTIAVAAGTYTNDISTITHSVTIAGVGGLAHFQSTELIANDKAILVDDAANLTIENLEFSGAQVADNNGAGIRWETGNLVIKNSYFHDNQEGILGTTYNTAGNATISGSTFTHNGFGDGQTHGLYVGHINQLTVTNNFFQDQIGGSDVKSRAAANFIDHNSFIDTNSIANGTNYQVDLPEGGNDTVSSNTVLKSLTANNWAAIHFGGEIANPVGSLLVQNNSVYSDLNPSVLVTDQTTGQPVQVLSNNIDTADIQQIVYSPTGTATNTTVSGTNAVGIGQAPATTLVVPTALDTGITLTSGTSTTTSTSTPSSGTILTVGVGQQFASLNAAIAASQDGDTIAVAPGTYTDDFSTITHSVTIEGVGGLAHLVSNEMIPNGKAILIDDAANLTIENLEFSGAQVFDGNGAGIRYETGNLVIKNSYFHDNQDGILGATYNTAGNVTVDGSTFTHNGAGDGQTHGLYIGHNQSLTVTNSFFQDQLGGSDVKSRAAANFIDHNNFIDTDSSSDETNYQVDLPEGGNDTVSHNLVLKSTYPNNFAIIHFGGEIANPIGSLLVQNNNFFSDRNPSVVVTDQTTGQPIQVLNNGIDTTDIQTIVFSPTGTPTNVTVSGSTPLDIFTQAPPTTLVIPTALPTGITLSGGSAPPTTTPPVTSVPGNQTVVDGSTLALAGISIADSGSNDSFTVTLAAIDGTVSTSGSAGSITGNGSGAVTLAGSLANVNADLAALGFTGTTIGSGSLQITTNDGNGGSDSHAIAIAVTNAPPVTTVPGNQTVVDASTLALTGISIADADGGNETFTVALAATDGTVSSSGGVGTISGNGSAAITLTGSLANVNADLASLSFTGTAIGAGSLQIATNDGNGGSDSHTIGITVTNATLVTSVPGNQTVVDASTLALTGISIADADGANETFTVALAAADGVISTSGGVGTISGNGSAAVTLAGSLANVNADLAALSFTGTAIGAGSLQINTSDGNGGSDSHTIGITVTDAPPVTSVPGNQSVVDTTTLALAGIGISDADGATQNFTVTLAATDGTVSTSGGAGSITGNGTAAVTLTGSLANMNADLAALSFKGTAIGAGSLQISTNDGNGGSNSHTIGISVSDAPPVTAVPGNQADVVGTKLALTGISIADPDGANQSFTVTLAGADGTVSTSGGAGTITGNGSGHITLAGSLANMNSDLAALSFTGTSIGGGSLQIITNDGAGGSDSHTIGINVTAPPMHTLMVGSGQTYGSLSAALAASHDGDTIVMQAGTYVTGQVTVNHAVTIEGSGGFAHLVAGKALNNGSALVTTANNVTLENLEISGITSGNHSAVAIRASSGNLTLANLSLHDNDSALSDAVAGSTIQASGSDFGHNGGGKSAAVNIGTVAEFDLFGSKVHDSVGVDQVRSTALTANIANDQIIDGTGSPIYAIDLPNVGNVVVSFSTLSRGAGALNASLINLGGGVANPVGFLTVHDSTMVSALSSTHVLNNHTLFTSVGFQNNGIGANITVPFIGQPPAVQGDYLI